MDDLKPCPFCGEQPSLETIGTCIEIYCCVSMSHQKIDIAAEMWGEQEKYAHLGEWDCSTYTYENEALVIKKAVKLWNTRHGTPGDKLVAGGVECVAVPKHLLEWANRCIESVEKECKFEGGGSPRENFYDNWNDFEAMIQAVKGGE